MLIILSEASKCRKDNDLNNSIQQRVIEDAETGVLREGNGDAEAKNLSFNIVEGGFSLKQSESITDKVTNLKVDEKVTGSNDNFSQEKGNKGGTIPVVIDLVSSEKVDLFLGQANQAEKAGEDLVDIIDNVVDISPVENHVMRKLLRGPRYFDPPENGCATCYNCGEEGHMSLHCTSARRKKPCFVCGSLEHIGRLCTSSKVRNCYICKAHSHLAKDCPGNKKRGNIQNSNLCLKCGGYGHDMFSCSGKYCPDDQKEIQCYVCWEFGHLCCKDYPDTAPKVVSCYKCGFPGHTGSVCKGSNQASTPKKKPLKAKLQRDSSDVSAPTPNNPGKGRRKRKANFEEGLLVCRTTTTNGAGAVSSCIKCGEEGHLKSECSNSKGVKLKNQVSNVKQKSVELPGDDLEVAPRSCFKCGEEGHIKSECTNSKAAKRSHQALIAKHKSMKLLRDDSEVTPGLCFKCGEEGHFKSECTNSKAAKRNHQASVAKPKSLQLLRDDSEVAPGSCFKCGEEGHFKNECPLNNQALTAKQKSVKLIRYDSEVAPSPSSKSFRKGKERTGDYEERHGWNSEHPRDVSYRNDRNAGWVHPATPLPYDTRVNRGSPATPFYYNGDSEVPPPSTNNIRSGGRKRKVNNEERLLPSSKSTHKHGWTSEHPGDLRNLIGRRAGWAPPATPLPHDDGANWGSSATPYYNNDVGYWGSHAMPCNNGVGQWDSPAPPYYNRGWRSPAAPYGYDNYAAFGHASTSYPANDTGYVPSNEYQSGRYAPQFRSHGGGAAGRHYHR